MLCRLRLPRLGQIGFDVAEAIAACYMYERYEISRRRVIARKDDHHGLYIVQLGRPLDELASE